MLLDQFYLRDDNGIAFTREQGSRFAKEVAGDFNPLHDVGAKRFCVPGDLLFAVVVTEKGLYEKMSFRFSGMVTDGISLALQMQAPGECALLDESGKEYLHAECSGDSTDDAGLIEGLVRNYVEFSGRTFPHILVPLLEKEGVMINPKRPMVIYERMEIALDRLDLTSLELMFAGAEIEVNGKRGEVFLLFNLHSGGQKVGHGKKKMLLSGLLPYEAKTVNDLVSEFNAIKGAYDPADPAL